MACKIVPNGIGTKSSNYRKNRNGSIVLQLQEVYTRDSENVEFCLSKSTPISKSMIVSLFDQLEVEFLYVLDTNIVLQYIDFLETHSSFLKLAVIPQTVVHEIRHLNISVYRKVVSLLKSDSNHYVFIPNIYLKETRLSQRRGESPNDYNDRCIVRVCEYLSQQFNKTVSLVTNDLLNQVS
jgi:exosome complex exonuclease DIS3/RRP44